MKWGVPDSGIASVCLSRHFPVGRNFVLPFLGPVVSPLQCGFVSWSGKWISYCRLFSRSAVLHLARKSPSRQSRLCVPASWPSSLSFPCPSPEVTSICKELWSFQWGNPQSAHCCKDVVVAVLPGGQSQEVCVGECAQMSACFYMCICLHVVETLSSFWYFPFSSDTIPSS